MNRLERFQGYRFVGTRDTMTVYDCDDQQGFDELASRTEDEGLLRSNLLQSFAPDTLDEARNRGFKLSPPWS
jgi:hypothetical protein